MVPKLTEIALNQAHDSLQFIPGKKKKRLRRLRKKRDIIKKPLITIQNSPARKMKTRNKKRKTKLVHKEESGLKSLAEAKLKKKKLAEL